MASVALPSSAADSDATGLENNQRALELGVLNRCERFHDRRGQRTSRHFRKKSHNDDPVVGTRRILKNVRETDIA